MTLQLNFPGQVAALGFGVNEISSAISIGRWVGSFLSVERDAQIFEALRQQYGVFCGTLPDHLSAVQLNRQGTVLGAGQRRIPYSNMLPNIQMQSVAGVATFIVLILRYVELRDDLVEYLHSLLKGELGLVHGGELEPKGQNNPKESLPHSIRDNLAMYIRGILDADADSQQHRDCLQWFSQLSSLIGKSRNPSSLSKYSRLDHHRLLKYLLDGTSSRPARFHTLSAGTAMIALAAQANGANIILQCATSSNEIVAIPENHPRRTNAQPIIVTLWLADPPDDIAQTLRVVGGTSGSQKRSRAKPSNLLPVYGGNSEISQMIALHLPFTDEADACLRLWEEGLRLGAKASWEVTDAGIHLQNFSLRLSETFVRTDMPALLAPLAKIWYDGPRADKRHELARKAANAYHAVYNHNNYHGLQVEEARQAMNLVLIAFAIGCLKSLVSNAPATLSVYALMLEEPYGPGSAPKGLLDFCVNLLDGCPVYDILCTAGSVWGGLPYRLGFTEGKLVGIVCPEVTILLDVLTNPMRTAEYGLDKGLFSLHTGSVPVLPRDHYGAILAGDPNPDRTYTTLKASTERRVRSDVSNVIFTLEPFTQSSGPLSAILCGWESGDVAFELDPFDVLLNLICKRTLKQDDSNSAVRGLTITGLSEKPLLCLHKNELAELQHFKAEGITAAIEAGARFDWQVVAAGCIFPWAATMVVSEEECNMVRRRFFYQTLGELGNIVYRNIETGPCLILCREKVEEVVSGGTVEEIGSDNES